MSFHHTIQIIVNEDTGELVNITGWGYLIKSVQMEVLKNLKERMR